MKLQLFALRSNVTFPDPPSYSGWCRQWHGYCQMIKVRSPNKIANNKKNYSGIQGNILNESEIERQIFLNIIHHIKKIT